MIFISVNTPTKTSGEGKGYAADLKYIESCAKQIADVSSNDKIIVEKSTVPVRTSEKIKNLEKFKPGENVQITDGVFKNCVAIFQSLKSDERVLLLINLMGQQQSIKIKKKSVIGL